MTDQAVQREMLPDRREGVLLRVTHQHHLGTRDYTVNYGFDSQGRVREIFCHNEKPGTDLDAIMSDACIAISHLLQRGMTVVELADTLGRDCEEMSRDGVPASPLGTIARVGVIVEQAEHERMRANAQAVEALK